MDRGDLDREIERLSGATSGIEPDDRFTSAIMDAVAKVKPAADPLAGIARATSAMDPGRAFADEVVARVGRARPRARAEAPSWLDNVVRTGPMAVGLAAALAAASVAFFLSSQSSLDVTVAASLDGVEVIE